MTNGIVNWWKANERLLKQIFVEFFPQLALSVAYATYVVYTSHNSTTSSVSTFINSFGADIFSIELGAGADG
jgi:hypothetical protein